MLSRRAAAAAGQLSPEGTGWTMTIDQTEPVLVEAAAGPPTGAVEDGPTPAELSAAASAAVGHGADGSAPSAPDRRWLALALLGVVQFMIVIDNTIVNVALPSIKHALGFSESGLTWVVIGYALAAAVLVML